MSQRRDEAMSAVKTTGRTPVVPCGPLAPRPQATPTRLKSSWHGYSGSPLDTVCWALHAQTNRQCCPGRFRLPLYLRLLLFVVGILLSLIAPTTNLVSACMAQTSAEVCPVMPDFRVFAGVGEAPTPTPQPRVLPPTHAFPAEPPAIAQFLSFALPYALQAHQALGWQMSVILAQWGLEQGWHVPSYTGYNWGNVSFAPGCTLKPGTHQAGSPATFCDAPTPQEGLREFLYAARLPCYRGVFAAISDGPDAVAFALGRSPWDAGHYASDGRPGEALIRLMKLYDLYAFDD